MSAGTGSRRAPVLDLSALRRRITVRDVESYYRRRRVPASRRWWGIASVVAVYLTGQTALIAVVIPLAGLGAEAERVLFLAVTAVAGAYGALLMAVIWRNATRPTRVDAAARANGLTFSDREATAAVFVGTLARHPSFSFVTDVVGAPGDGGATPAGVVGPFTAGTISARPGTIRRRGILQIPLGRETPHIVLENRRAGALASVGRRFRAGQRLSLEGDFDRTFTLYCPAGYETDALYIFAPDLMALMLDVAPDLEVELTDGHLVLYSGKPWRLWRAERFAAVVALAAALGPKARRQTARYTDPRRLLGERIAAGGRRLRVRPSLGAMLSTAVPVGFAAFSIWGLIAGA